MHKPFGKTMKLDASDIFESYEEYEDTVADGMAFSVYCDAMKYATMDENIDRDNFKSFIAKIFMLAEKRWDDNKDKINFEEFEEYAEQPN